MQFFVFDTDAVGSPYEIDFRYLPPKIEGDTARCPACGVFISLIPTLPPYHIELTAFGKQLGDVASGPGDGWIVSDRFRNAWQQAGLRGIESFDPLERLRIRPARLGKRGATYFHLSPRRFGTYIDIVRSVIDYDKPYTCEKCKSGSIGSIRGFTIDEASWTGEDIFIAWGILGSIIVTDRVRQLRDDYGLTNVNLTPVEEYWWDPYSRWKVCDYSPPDGVVYEYCTEEEAKSNLERARKTR